MVYYSSLCQLLKVLLLSWYIRGIIVLYILVSVLASYIYTLGYLLGYLPSKASFLVLLFLFLKVLLLYFWPLLNLFRALKYLPPITTKFKTSCYTLALTTAIVLTVALFTSLP